MQTAPISQNKVESLKKNHVMALWKFVSLGTLNKTDTMYPDCMSCHKAIMTMTR